MHEHRRNSNGEALPPRTPQSLTYDDKLAGLTEDVIAERPADWTTDDWATPPEIVAELAAEFGPFDLDVCCRPETAKARTFYTRADDGLNQPWFGRVWLNPPYSDPEPWLRRAMRAVEQDAEVVVALLPASTDTGWFHDCVLNVAEVRFRRGRIRFLGWMGTPIGSPKAGSMFAIYRKSATKRNAVGRQFDFGEDGERA